LTPERSIEIQQQLGSDIAMVLDHVVALPNERDVLKDAMQRSVRWAKRCRDYQSEESREQQAIFGIVQGGLDAALRRSCAEQLAELDLRGYAVGGLSVGETPEEMFDALDFTVPFMPDNKPRYLMGVGRPEDILNGVKRGIDLFDCVMPSRNGRNAMAFTKQGAVRLRNVIHQCDTSPLETDCPCPACKHSRGYLRHLFQSGEMLGPVLLTIHNITHYQRLMSDIRTSIEQNNFATFYKERMEAYQSTAPTSEDNAE
jgi:queuine tRNA-ribosyltransferase